MKSSYLDPEEEITEGSRRLRLERGDPTVRGEEIDDEDKKEEGIDDNKISIIILMMK